MSQDDCHVLWDANIVIPRTTFIATTVMLAITTTVSLLALGVMLYRQRRQDKAASTWGRQSRYVARTSMLRKEVDDSFSRQYHGCLINEPENPEMGSDDPVEIGVVEERICEVPATPPIPHKARVGGRSKSLWFDEGSGLWVPRK